MLEDFFTLTEMNNGLTAPIHVRELLALMEKERDYIAKNVGDATRQWSIVAKAIATTENKDCLDLFVQLDGLQLMDIWLKDAQKFSNDTNDSSVEESITHLLGALEKLHVDNVKLVSCGIWTTVENLLGHNSPKVQLRAKTLFDSWKKDGYNGASSQNVKIVGESTDGEIRVSADIKGDSGHKESSLGDASLSRESSDEEKHQKSTRDDPSPSRRFDALQANKVEDALASEMPLGQPTSSDTPLDRVISPSFSKAANENISDTVDPLCISKGSTSTESFSFTVQRQDRGDGRTDFQESEFACEIKQPSSFSSSPDKLGPIEESKLLENGAFPSRSGAGIGLNSVTEPSLQKLADASDRDSCQKGSSFDDLKTIDSGGGTVDDGGCADEHRIKEGGNCKSDDDERSRENIKDSRTFLSMTEDAVGVDKPDQHVTGQSDDDLANDYNFVKREMDRDTVEIYKKSDIELEYGIVDPLELAQQATLDMKREVDFREHSFSSREKVQEDEIQQPDSPDTVSRKESHACEGPRNEETEPAQSAEASPIREESELDADEKNGTQDMETSLITKVAPEEVNTEKGLCNFDLNLELCSEDTYSARNQNSTPVSVVSASRVTAYPGLPVAPLQFEGTLGWKGSAATSAFHPASPRHIHEGDKGKKPQGCFEIDLNVAESEDGKGNLLPDRRGPKYSALPSRESLAEASSISEHLELDLNRASADGDVPSDWRSSGQLFPLRNGHHIESHSSLSSKQPSLRNFDLNDQPAFLNNSLDHSYFSKSPNYSNTFGGIKLHDSVISIMGTKVDVNHKDFIPEALPLLDGRTPELALDINLGRSGSVPRSGSVLYDIPTVYSYNDHAPRPPTPFTSMMYGPGVPIPYMVDSRGLVPQIVDPASAQQPAFLTMAGSTSLNGGGPSRNSFDLNSGLTLEGESHDPAGLRQFFSSGQSSSNTSSVGEKRKEPEPETGCEHNPPFKHHTPPWK
ncbi:unnamed protein product [Fraxinus pennsylvanica]|uniref:TFIIS N-terminal domain-containing protein n=1 Tax=Fraxinus pennsylvanica TaxID=56036 RepID=A0AAD1YM73_9LAMI|nr:unnamed protein product [Fraxinus pennsylvanica]